MTDLSISKTSQLISWKKSIWSCVTQIFKGSTRIGSLKNKLFSLSMEGSLEGSKLQFKMVSPTKASIIDLDSEQTIGQIQFNLWYPNAKINMGMETFKWKYSNWKETKWKVIGGNKTIEFCGFGEKGKINSQQNNPILLLTGLYVSIIYQQWVVAAISFSSILVMSLA